MQDRFKFRFWNNKDKKMQEWNGCHLWQALNNEELVPMQCTGLNDQNGKLIFEGDIVKIETCLRSTSYPYRKIRNIDVFYTVNYQEANAALYLQRKYIFDIPIRTYVDYPDISNDEEITLIDLLCDSEYIGNIYENPELLEH